MRILTTTALALSSVLSLYSSSSSQQEKKSQIPDFFQTHKELKELGGKGCAPVSVSNILTYLDTNGFPNMLDAEIPDENDQLELVKLISSKDYMATGKHGTNPPFVMKGLEKYVKDRGYKIDIKYKGFEGAEFLTDKEPPSPKWIKEEVNKGSHVVLRFGFYRPPEKESKEPLKRVGGHYVTLVNCKSENEVEIHDPYPSSKDDKLPKKDLYKFSQLPEVTLFRDPDLPKDLVSGKDHWKLDPSPDHYKRHLMILEGAIVFKVKN